MEYGHGPPPRGPDDPVPPRDGEYVADDPALAHEELADRLRSLRTMLALVALLSLAALGVGLWALLEDANDRDRRGASPERVSQLEDRADELERELDNRASDESVEELRGEQEQLADRVEALGEATSGDETEQALESLRQDVAELEQRVEELEAQQEQGSP